MRKYLVVLDFSTGIAQVHNIGVFEAPDALEARKKACTLWRLTHDAIYASKMAAYPIEDLQDGWSYFV